ncbi:ABC transporter substrate-binding protein [Desulfotignum balticum]|uniref:Periplasmic amino acid-binding protein of amino acid ABC transporter n=1 Tax=Desulfotignum balticum TaxID=115781 RepID=B2DD64_9BACT|nr:ABC transporter substrate-binding protein [Desulfotignum balticum]BAG28253.1 periplasmic amino acid-binding protein of amino acid ABC transporter [Desulfotignum balticum]
MKKKLFASFILALAVIAVTWTCAAAGDSRWSKIEQSGSITVGNCPEYPPFSFRNTSGLVEGFDSDFARALGNALGVDVVIKDTAWEGLVAGMKKGDHDIIISCMSPEEATQASDSVNMSNPYYQLSEIIVTRSDVTDITTKEDLAGRIVGVQANSTSEVAGDSLADMDIKVKDLRRYNRNSEALIDLKNKRVDAVVVGFAYAATKIKDSPDLKIINDPVRSVDIVVVLDHGEDELTEKINQAIDTVKSNGDFDRIHDKWLAL